MTKIKCNASGYEMCELSEALELLDKHGIDNPIDAGYQPEELTWLNPDYVRSSIDADWPEEVPYWYATT